MIQYFTLEYIHLFVASYLYNFKFITFIIIFFITYFLIRGPYLFTKDTFSYFFKLFYKTKIVGLENYEKIRNERMIIIANHESFIDAPLIVSHLPDQLSFAIKPQQARKWFMKPFLKLVKTIEINSMNPLAIKDLIRSVKNGGKLLIFPEGRITTTGNLMKMYPGAAVIAQRADAYILPIRIENAVLSVFSILKFKKFLFPTITLHILPPQKLDAYKDLKPKQRREKSTLALYKMMSHMIFKTNLKKAKPLFESLIQASHFYGKNHVILEDIERKKMTYKKLLQSVYVLSQILPKEKRIAILLPNVIPTVVVFFALQKNSSIPVMLNYSSGINNMLLACKIAKVETIITSQKFLEKLNIEKNQFKNLNVICLEDLKSQIGLKQKIMGIWAMKFSPIPKHNLNDPCYILFTSGSEGVPKGVVLTHKNIQANVCQMMSRFDFNQEDRIFNTMPMFHSFGITCGTMLPVFNGIKIFLFPNPLEFKLIPELLYDSSSTIMFATNSFLKGYAKFASLYDFHSVRYIFAGAEKLQEETRQLYFEKFGKLIYEGYGTTEASPVVSVNSQMYNQIGSVGLLLPGLQYKIEPVEGIEQAGLLYIKGPNLMYGYLGMKPLGRDYYNTGDIVTVDQDEFITIVGRLKRFAKIHGEMVDLTFLESLLQEIWPSFEQAVISKMSKSGEEIVLFTTNPQASIEDIAKEVMRQKYSLLMVPKKIHVLEKMLRLGSGKIDYLGLQEL